MKKIGYWWRSDFAHLKEYADLPKAHDHIDPDWDMQERFIVASYLARAEFENDSFRGMSRCRICNVFNGSRDYTDGVYLWPEGLVHYVQDHNVKPPQDFIDHVMKQFAAAVGH